MKTAHGIIQGYNSQALIDGKQQVIIHGEAFGNGQDYTHGPPMLEGARENLQHLGHGEDYLANKILTADTNYHSDIILRKYQELGLDAYIPDRFFRRQDPRYAAQSRYWPLRKTFALEDFSYAEDTNQYVCPHRKRLSLKVKKAFNVVPYSCGALLSGVANADISGCPSGWNSPICPRGWPARLIVNGGLDIPPKVCSGRTRLCQYSHPQTFGPLYPQREGQDQYPAVTLLHGP